MKSFKTMLAIEMKLSLRGLDMVIFAVLMPTIIAIIIGLISGSKAAYEGAPYTFYNQSFGSLISIGMFASGIMGIPLVLADYRDKKILKSMKVTPISPFSLVLVHITIGLIYSVISAILVYLTSIILFDFTMEGSAIELILIFLLVMLMLFSIGILIAAVAKDIRSVNIICSIVYFPMLLLSGATIPYEIMPDTLRKISDLLPLTQGIKLLKSAVLGFNDMNYKMIVFMLISSIIIATFGMKNFKWE